MSSARTEKARTERRDRASSRKRHGIVQDDSARTLAILIRNRIRAERAKADSEGLQRP